MAAGQGRLYNSGMDIIDEVETDTIRPAYEPVAFLQVCTIIKIT